MPEVNENTIRIPVKDAKLFIKNSIKTISLSEKQGIKALIGILKSDASGGTAIMTYLFDTTKWSLKEAQSWVKAHVKKSFTYMIQSALQEVLYK